MFPLRPGLIDRATSSFLMLLESLVNVQDSNVGRISLLKNQTGKKNMLAGGNEQLQAHIWGGGFQMCFQYDRSEA